MVQPSTGFQDDLSEILVPKVLGFDYLIDSKIRIGFQNWRNVMEMLQGWLIRDLVSMFKPGK